MIEDDKVVWEPGGTEAETSAGTARRYRKPLRSFRWCDIKVLLGDTFDEWTKHKAPRLGAALAFYTALSLAPLLVVVLAIIGVVFGQDAARGQLFAQIRDMVGDLGAKAIEEIVIRASQPAVGTFATLVGLFTLFIGATGVVGELRDALNTIWEVPSPEVSGLRGLLQMVRERFFSFAMVLGVGFLLLVSLVINAWLAAVGTRLSGWLPEVAMQGTSTIVSFLVVTALFALIYKAMPDVTIEWRDVILGAAVTSLLFNIGKLLIGIYLGKSTMASAYGAAGSLVVTLVWVYYSAQIFFLGAEFTQVFANRYGSQPTLRAKRAILGKIHTPTPPPVPVSSASCIVKPEHGGKQLV